MANLTDAKDVWGASDKEMNLEGVSWGCLPESSDNHAGNVAALIEK